MSYLFKELENFDADISNWVTSGVTDMKNMFEVRSSRSSRAPQPNLRCRALPCTLLPYADAVPRPFRLLARNSPRTVCPPFDSRQGASAFNQPLSFDTSSVTTMYFMFYVRSSPCPAANLQSSSLLCTLRARCGRPPPPACQPVHLALHHIPSSFRLSAESVGVQPAAVLRYV